MRNHLARTSFLLAAVVTGSACGGGGDGDLDPDVVTDLPPGDATGSAATGTYAMESVTTACDGGCTIDVDGFTYSACDVGTRLDEDAAITQTDGALQIDVDDSDYVSRLTGGLFADGSYDVGGLVTQQGGQVTITSRSTGTLSATTMAGTARLLVDGMGLDCRITVDVSGARQSLTAR